MNPLRTFSNLSRLAVASLAICACNTIDLATEPSGLVLFDLTMLSGNAQTVLVGTPVDVVAQLVSNGTNNTIGGGQNAEIRWTVTSGGGTVVIGNSRTDLVGKSAAKWTLGPAAGEQTLTATVVEDTDPINPRLSTNPKHTVTFRATALSNAVDRITVLPETTIVVGGSYAVRYSLFNGQNTALTGRNVTVFSSNANVLRVDFGAGGATATGLVAGTADVIVQSEGKEGRARVTIAAAPPPVCTAGTVCTVTLSTNQNRTTVQVGHTLLFQTILRDQAGNQILTGATIVYSVTNGTMARIDPAAAGGPPGYFADIVGLAAGRVTVTATANGKSGSVVIDVTP